MSDFYAFLAGLAVGGGGTVWLLGISVQLQRRKQAGK